MVSADSVEAVLTEIGFGRWQGFIMFVLLIAYVVGPVQQLGSTLLSAPVPFRCSYPDFNHLDNLTNMISGEYQIEHLNVSRADFPSKCLLVNDLADFSEPRHHQDVSKTSLSHHATGLPSCPEIEYDTSVFESTVILEWDLVCERSNMRPLYQMMFSVGSLLCSTFGGQLSDWLGRKRTFQIGAILTLSAVVATSIMPWYGAMLFMRILSGTGTILMVFPSYTLLSEISPINRRTITALCPGIVYFATLPLFAGVAYLVPNWRMLLLLCNTPLLLLIPLSFTIDESPRWLLQRGRRNEAVTLLRKAAKQNGVILTPATSTLIDSFSQNSDADAEQQRDLEKLEARNQGSIRMLRTCFTSPGMRTILIISPLMMFLKRSLHIGVLLNANNFTSTNPFEYIAISGTMGVVAIVLSISVSQRLGRRVIIGGALFIGGALMFLELPVPSDYWWAKLIMVMTSFAIVCAAFQVTFAYRAELFPTVIRTRGFTFTNLVGALGEMGIPLVTEIAVHHQWWAASVTFGLTGIIGSLLLPLLPETKDRPMPDTLQDVEDRYWQDFKGLSSKKKNSDEAPNGEAVALQA